MQNTPPKDGNPGTATLTDELDVSAYAFALVMREAVQNQGVEQSAADFMKHRMGEVMDHLLAGKDINTTYIDGVFTATLVD